MADAFIAKCAKAAIRQYRQDARTSHDLSRIISEREFDLLLGWIDPAKVTHGALMTVAAIDTTFDIAVGCAADIIPLPLDESRTGHLRKAVHAED